MTRRYAYKYALPLGRADLDEIRRRAITECYREAVKNDYYPVAKPQVHVDISLGYDRYASDRPFLEVTVECLP